ncbi:MAG: DUF58 domain-containing protein [Bdellovibrionota bacterium]
MAEEAVRTKNYSFILPAVLNLDPLRFRADAFDSSATNDLTQEEIDRLQAGYDPRVIVMRALVKIIEATAPADPELKKYLEDFFQYFSPRFKPGIIHRFSPRDIKVTYDREITTALNPRFIEGVASRNFLQKLSPEQICQFLDLINHNLSFELIPLQQRSLDDQGIFTSSEKSRPSAVHRNNLNQEQIEAAIGLYLLVMENPSFSKVDMSQDLQQSILTTISYLYAAYSRDAELFSSGSSLKAAKTKSDLVEVFLRISKLPVEGAELTDQTQIFRAWINNYLNSSEIGQVCFEIILSDSNLNYPNLNLGFQSREVGRLCLQAVESLISASEQVTSDLVIRLIDRISKLNDSGVSIEGQEIIQLRNILSKLDFTELFKADPLALGSLLEPSPICKLFLLKSNFKAAKFYRSAKNFCEKHNIPLDILLAGIEFPGSERREKTEKDLTQAFIKFAELVSTNHGLELRVVKRGKSWRDNQKDVWISGFDILRSNKFTEFLLYTYRCRSSEDARDNNNFTDFGNSDFHSLMNSVIELVNRLDGSEAELDEIYASLDSDTLVDIGYSLVDGNKGGIDLFKSNNSQFQQVMRGIVKGQISRLFQGVSPQEAYRSIVWVNFVLDFLKEEHLKNTKNSRREFNLTSAIFNHIPNFAVLERGFPEGERVDAAESIRTALAKLPSLPFDEVHEAELSSRAKTAALITFGLLKLHPRENLESHYSSAKEIVAEELLSMLGICGKLANPICSDLLKKLDEPASGWQLLFSTWPENGGIDLLKICDQLVAEFSHILRSQNRRLRTVYRGYLVDKTGKFFPISSAGDPVHLRHYQIGDDPKTINTKVSARRDRTVVNVYEEQEIRKVQMFIDVDYLVDRFEVARGEFRAKVNLDRVKEVFRQIFLANLQGLPLELTICGRGEIKTYRGLGRTATLLKEYILMRKQDREADAEYLYNDPDSVTIFRALFNELKLIFEASVSTLRAEAAIYGQEGFPAINVFPQAEALKHSLNVLHVLFISRKNLRATSIPLTSMRKNKMHLAVITE